MKGRKIMTVFETERLLARRPRPSDADAFFDMFTDAQTCRDDGGYPPYTQKDETFLRDFDSLFEDYDGRFFLEEKQSGRLIGVMHLMPASVPRRLEIGYVIHRAYRNRGYATEAAGGLMRWVRRRDMADEISASAYLFNGASQRVIEKLGFAPTGEMEAPGTEYAARVYRKLL